MRKEILALMLAPALSFGQLDESPDFTAIDTQGNEHNLYFLPPKALTGLWLVSEEIYICNAAEHMIDHFYFFLLSQYFQ